MDCLQPLIIRRVSDLESLHETVVTYTSRAAEKLCDQGDYFRLLRAYIRTGLFTPEKCTTGVPLPCTTQHASELVRAALAVLQNIYRRDYRYQKAGVVLLELASPDRSRMACSSRNHDQATKR